MADDIKQPELKLKIPLASYRKLMAYVDLADGEISGFADVEFDKEKLELVMGEVYLLEQEVGPTETEMDEEQISDFLVQMIKAGKTQLPRMWWHSHVNMGVFWSGTDESTMKNLQNDSFMVSMVVNKLRQMKARFILNEPLRWEMDDVPVSIKLEYDEYPHDLIEEVATKVKERSNNYWDNKDKKEKGSQILLPGEKGYNQPDEEDIEEYYRTGGYRGKSGKWIRPKGKKKKSIMFLPKDRIEALGKIEELDLIMEYDFDLQEDVWINTTSGTIYRDFHGVIKETDKKMKN